VRAGAEPSSIRAFDDVASAWRDAQANANEADRIVVFGSFLTVAAALADGRQRATRSSS
jgi:folylpolyglutamate synthase/dihydropteroate synthase